MKQKKERILKRFCYYYRNHKFMFFLDMLASLIMSLLGIVYPIVTRKIFNTYVVEENVRAIIYAGLILLGIYVIYFNKANVSLSSAVAIHKATFFLSSKIFHSISTLSNTINGVLDLMFFSSLVNTLVYLV